MSEFNPDTRTVGNAVRLLGDFVFLPGASQILEGKYASGFTHAGIGVAGRLFLWHPVGLAIWLATAANSYSQSTEGKPITAFLDRAKETAKDTVDGMVGGSSDTSDEIAQLKARIAELEAAAG